MLNTAVGMAIGHPNPEVEAKHREWMEQEQKRAATHRLRDRLHQVFGLVATGDDAEMMQRAVEALTPLAVEILNKKP